jgi:hypothetical protein
MRESRVRIISGLLVMLLPLAKPMLGCNGDSGLQRGLQRLLVIQVYRPSPRINTRGLIRANRKFCANGKAECAAAGTDREILPGRGQHYSGRRATDLEIAHPHSGAGASYKYLVCPHRNRNILQKRSIACEICWTMPVADEHDAVGGCSAAGWGEDYRARLVAGNHLTEIQIINFYKA